jgi:mono/diheme cytochrome c family protein
MTWLARQLGVWALLLALPALADPAKRITFEGNIRAILRAHCLDCHGAETEKEGNLDLRLVRFALQGGDSGPALVPHDPDASRLVQRIRDGEMPPGKGKVSSDELAQLEEWIRQGAPTQNPEPQTIPDGLGVSTEDRQWWAFQPIRSPDLPFPILDPHLRRPADVLVAKNLPAGVSLSPDAGRDILLKRLFFDLVGLPPTRDDIEHFLADTTPDAWERLIDRTLSSPQYGERWARHWLDVVGYADSEGGTPNDAPRPFAYRYRDYVIDAFNGDLPFHQFITEQLAGDELAGPIVGDLSPRQVELLTATGYLRMAADGTGSGDDSPEARNQVVADTIKIVSTSLLGLSVACAQCHDHRYDPILQRDYYSLRAVLEPALDWQSWKPPQARLVSLYTDENRRKAREIETQAQQMAVERQALLHRYLMEARQVQLNKFDEAIRGPLRAALDTPADKRTPEQQQLLAQNPSVQIEPGTLYQYNQAAADDLKSFDQRIAEVRSQKPVEEFIHALVEPVGLGAMTRRFHRGDYRQPLETITPAVPTVLAPENQSIPLSGSAEKFSSSRRRLALARWLTGPDNPLTPRVLVNRFWMHHFGEGLVKTPADFGRLGTPPHQPDLLDWLALEFRTREWSLKQLHREILESTVYRQSSNRTSSLASSDPENRSLGRRPIVRLDAEILRDRVLATTGTLETTLHGPASPLTVDETGQVIIDPAQRRRTIYTTQKRSQPVALLQAFDAPVMQTNCEARSASTVATQSLMLMNGSFMLDQAYQLSQRIRRESASGIPAPLASQLVSIGGQPLTPTWQFGFGSAQPTADLPFHPLPHWTGSSWQGGPELPHGEVGWATLSAHGGHPGKNPGFATIRRFTSPIGGRLAVRGSLVHPSENGDGIRASVMVQGQALVAEWVARHAQVQTNIDAIEVHAGQTVDFLVDCREHETSDSFGWEVVLALTRNDGTLTEFSSTAGFHGPIAVGSPITTSHIALLWQSCYQRWPTDHELRAALSFVQDQLANLISDPTKVPAGRTAEDQSLTHLAHVLLSSNEFLYVD